MGNIINSLIGIVLIALFLAGYAVGVRSLPFALIVVGVLALVGFDFYQTVKKENGRTDG
ncbi:MAG: hypothetical protein HYR52_05060 [Candidatus Tectomicrobia bacterium]|nr:hypothetical protein [Candidatus Tectomicrobia bacterium]